MIDRRSFLARSSLLLLAGALPQASFALAPSGRLIFGVPGNNAIGHQLGAAALEVLGSQFDMRYQMDIVDGRNTLQASEAVKISPADGMTLLQAQSGSMVLFPALYKSLKYDPLTDFTPVAMLGDYTYALSVGPAVPASVTNIDQYLAWVGQNPDMCDIGFSIYGSQGHLAALMLARGKEVALRPQSYKSAPALFNDMASQNVAAGMGVAGNIALLGQGKARPIAVTGTSRQAAWPEVATFREQGLKDTVIEGWYGWFAPASTPAATLQSLREKASAMLATPQFIDAQKKLLVTPHIMTPAQITQRMRDEIASYKKLVDSYNLSQIV